MAIYRSGTQLLSRISSISTDAALVGNITAVGSFTSVTVSGSDLQHADIDTNTAVGDLVNLTSGTGATAGFYRITAVGVNAVTLDRAPGGAGVNIACTVFKDCVAIFATDATNGQRIMNYSHQNKPLQIGGDVLVVTSNLSGDDVTIGGRVGFPCGTNDDGIVFGSLGTATKAIDLSGSNLSGATDYQIYIGASDYWTASGKLSIADNFSLGGAGFGTNAAKTQSFGQWTQPTTSPADVVQIGGADEGGRDGYTQLHMRNEAGQLGALAFQAPLVNLLSNSGFGVWSNGTLENVGSNLVTGWVNIDYDTFTSVGADITSAISTDVGLEENARSNNNISVTAGKLYKFVFNLTLNSGSGPWIIVYSGNASTEDYNTGVHLTGSAIYTYIYEAQATGSNAYVYLRNITTVGNWSATVTLFEVTPGTVAADTLAADGHSKTSTLDAHEYWNAGSANTYGYGKYLLKLTKGADTAEYYNFNTLGINYRDVQGKKVTFGAYVYSTTAADNIKLSIYDGVSEIAVSSFVGADTITWVEVTGTVAANATAITARILADGDTSDVAYISQPMLIKAPALGAGNYAPSPNETIYTEKVIALTDYTATTSAADATINLEAQSSGFIPKGVKAVLVKAYAKDSAAADGIGFDVQSASGVEDGLSIDTQVNNIRVQGVSWIKADANGDIYFDHRGSGASALTVDIKVIGVQP